MSRIYHRYPSQSKIFLSLLCLILVLANLHPAHAQTAAEQIVETHQNISKDVDQAITSALSDLVSTPVFAEAANVGVFISIAGFAPVLIRASKVYKIDDAVDTDSLVSSIFTLALILLLLGTPTTRGRLLADVVVGVNDVTNFLSARIIKKAAGEDGESIVAQEVAKTNAESVKDVGVETCSKIAAADQRQACLDEVKKDVEEAVKPFDAQEWAQTLVFRTGEQLFKLTPFGAGVYASGKFFADTAKIAGPAAFEFTLKSVSYLLGQAFVVGVEHMKILMVIVSPIFLSLHMVPLFRGWFTTWLKNFMMLEIALLFFNLIITLVAITLLKVDDVSSAIFPFVVAAMSIVFTLSLVGGGGISLYSQAVSTSVGVASAVRGAIK